MNIAFVKICFLIVTKKSNKIYFKKIYCSLLIVLVEEMILSILQIVTRLNNYGTALEKKRKI